ncbi:MAG: Glu/Leu/Phe/Val dehydrogenase [Pseudomonadota bacterium]
MNDAKKFGSLANVTAEFKAAADFLSLTKDQRVSIEEPRYSVRLKLPIRMDNGSIKVFMAYHTVHSIILGPSIGGVQFRPDVNWDTIEALAFWSTHRSALLNIPFGGSCGAIECDPAMYSVGELERLSRRYVTELYQLINPNNDILTSDIGTNQQIMCWAMDSYSAYKKNYTPAMALGKPVDLGGTKYSTYPTTIGVELCIKKACEQKGININGAKVAIQGFGKVGLSLAQALHKDGAKIIAIADVSGAYYRKDGIDVEKAVWHQQSNGMLDGLEVEMDIEKMKDPMEIFALPVDVLVPAAVELQITEANMFDVKAKVIAEVAQDPVSPIADKYLHEKGRLIIPDILCNSGGTIGHYLEWVQNRSGYYWPEDRVHAEIQNVIGKAFDRTIEQTKKHSISMRLAAAILAVERVAKTAALRGAYA